jgi:hypothetical protein
MHYHIKSDCIHECSHKWICNNQVRYSLEEATNELICQHRQRMFELEQSIGLFEHSICYLEENGFTRNNDTVFFENEHGSIMWNIVSQECTETYKGKTLSYPYDYVGIDFLVSTKEDLVSGYSGFEFIEICIKDIGGNE